MKTLPAILATSLLLISFGASANDYFERVATETQSTQAAPNKAAAYQLGLAKLAQLKAQTSDQLSDTLNTPIGDIKYGSLNIKANSYVTVQERMDASGKVSYVGLVNIGYGYVLDDNDD